MRRILLSTAVSLLFGAPAVALQTETIVPAVGGQSPSDAEGASTASVSSAAPQAARVGAYRINPGDELEIYVWGEERLQRQVKVLPDGTIAFPLVGKILVQNFLPSEVEAMITNGLRDQYRGQVPQVTVSVVQPSGMQFSVMGRVRSPGTFTPGRYINVLEALSMAGGPSEFANLDNVLIIRKEGDELRTMRVRLAPLFKMGGNSGDIARANILRIQTGDTVIVP